MLNNLGFIGFGNMAQALAAAWRLIPEVKLHASAPSLANGINDAGIQTYNNNLSITERCDVIILAVKPQQALSVLAQIADSLLPNSIVVSVVAGLSLQKLMSACQLGQAIVRSMPNLPVAYNLGATPLLANANVSKSQHLMVEKLFSAVGIINWVLTDDLIDRFTALSGSGPAYFLYFLEALVKAGETLGLEPKNVHEFVLQTAKGTLALINDPNVSLATLRSKITSPGGTTAAAINVLQTADLMTLINTAVDAAYLRAKELKAL